MKFFTYATALLVLLFAGIMATEYGYTAQLVGADIPNQKMLGYPVSYGESGKVMSSAFVNGETRSFFYDQADELETLPGPKAYTRPITVNHTYSANRTVVHNSRNVCVGNTCNPTYRSGCGSACGTVYYYPNTYYRSGCHQGSCGSYGHWQYRSWQPVRNAVRYFHNVRPVRSCFGRFFGGGCGSFGGCKSCR